MWRSWLRCSTSRLLLSAATLSTAAIAGDGSGSSGPARAWAQEILVQGPYQTDLPIGASSSGFAIPFVLRGLSTMLLGLAGLVVLVLLAIWLVRETRVSPRRDAGGAGGDSRAPDTGGDPVAEVQRLAHAGRYAEAIHALLLVAIRQLGRVHELQPSPSRTSREILRTVAFSATERHALGELVRHVELSRFGGRAVGLADYEHCRDCLLGLGARPR